MDIRLPGVSARTSNYTLIPMPEELALQTVIFALNGGILSLLISDRIRMPSIILFLISGILLGPFFLNLVQPKSLGPLLPVIIELGVALIMFEGSMNLNIGQYRAASKAIRNLLTIGVSISVICLLLMARWLFGWPWGICLLFGILMSVTGPTVIAPILRKVPLKQPIGSILHWESVLLEPLIVIGAILVVEFIIQTEITVADSLLRLLKIIGFGAFIGTASGLIVTFIMRRFPLKNEGFRNLFVVSIGLLIFEVANMGISDSGLVAVVFAGIILGNSPIPALYEIKQFKETVTRLMISFLFILLSANLNWERLITFSPRVIFFLIVLIFLIRPAVVFASMPGSGLKLNSKVFLSLTAPRGIVAASLASLFTIVFAKQGSTQAGEFEILAYQIIFVTVFLQALWSKPVSAILKVQEKEKKGYMIVGAHALGVGIANWIKKKNIEIVLVDRDSYDVYLARKKGLSAHKGDALNEYFIEQLPLAGIGKLLALTSNDEVNTLACQLGKRYFGKDKTFQIHKSLKDKDESFLKAAGGMLIFPKLPNLLKTLEEIRKNNFVFEEFQGTPPEDFIPLFISPSNGSIQPVTDDTNFNEQSLVFGIRRKDLKSSTG